MERQVSMIYIMNPLYWPVVLWHGQYTLLCEGKGFVIADLMGFIMNVMIDDQKLRFSIGCLKKKFTLEEIEKLGVEVKFR